MKTRRSATLLALILAHSGLGLLAVAYWLSLTEVPFYVCILSVLDGLLLIVLAALVSPPRGLRFSAPIDVPAKPIVVKRHDREIRYPGRKFESRIAIAS